MLRPKCNWIDWNNHHALHFKCECSYIDLPFNCTLGGGRTRHNISGISGKYSSGPCIYSHWEKIVQNSQDTWVLVFRVITRSTNGSERLKCPEMGYWKGEKNVPLSYLRTSYRSWILPGTLLSQLFGEQPIEVELILGKVGQKWTPRAEVMCGETGAEFKGELTQDRACLFVMESSRTLHWQTILYLLHLPAVILGPKKGSSKWRKASLIFREDTKNKYIKKPKRTF